MKWISTIISRLTNQTKLWPIQWCTKRLAWICLITKAGEFSRKVFWVHELIAKWPELPNSSSRKKGRIRFTLEWIAHRRNFRKWIFRFGLRGAIRLIEISFRMSADASSSSSDEDDYDYCVNILISLPEISADVSSRRRSLSSCTGWRRFRYRTLGYQLDRATWIGDCCRRIFHQSFLPQKSEKPRMR